MATGQPKTPLGSYDLPTGDLKVSFWYDSDVTEDLNPNEQLDDRESLRVDQLFKDKMAELWPLLSDNYLVAPMIRQYYPESQVVVRGFEGPKLAVHLFKVDEGTEKEVIGFATSQPSDGARPDLPGEGAFRYTVENGDIQGYVGYEPYEVNKAKIRDYIRESMYRVEGTY